MSGRHGAHPTDRLGRLRDLVRALALPAHRRSFLLLALLCGGALLLSIVPASSSWPPGDAQRGSQLTAGASTPDTACRSLTPAAHPCMYRYFVADLRILGAQRNVTRLHPGDTLLVTWAARPDNHAYPTTDRQPVELQLLLFGPFASLDEGRQFGYALGKAWTFPTGWPRTGRLVQAAWPQPPLVATEPLDSDSQSDLIVMTRLIALAARKAFLRFRERYPDVEASLFDGHFVHHRA